MGDASHHNQHPSNLFQHYQDHLLFSASRRRLEQDSRTRTPSANDMSINNHLSSATSERQQSHRNEAEPLAHLSSNLSSLSQMKHWTEAIYEVKGLHLEDFNIAGGSDYGQFPYLSDSGDILLEINSQRVAGLTRTDVIDLIKSTRLVDVKAVSSNSSLPIDLRSYMSHRFLRESIDHDLQSSINENLYMRTIPSSDRPLRPNDADYKFMSNEELLAMERSVASDVALLESRIFPGAQYSPYTDRLRSAAVAAYSYNPFIGSPNHNPSLAPPPPPSHLSRPSSSSLR